MVQLIYVPDLPGVVAFGNLSDAVVEGRDDREQPGEHGQGPVGDMLLRAVRLPPAKRIHWREDSQYAAHLVGRCSQAVERLTAGRSAGLLHFRGLWARSGFANDQVRRRFVRCLTVTRAVNGA